MLDICLKLSATTDRIYKKRRMLGIIQTCISRQNYRNRIIFRRKFQTRTKKQVNTKYVDVITP